MNYNYNTTGLMNQLYRQKENIENMITQYSQNFSQPPVQNIINTNGTNDIDVKFLQNNEDISNIIISKKTLFIDENNSKITLKEIDGTVSKEYNIIVPKDAKDLKIEELENKLKELEGKIDVKSAKSNITNNDVKSTSASASKFTKSTTTTSF